MWSKGKNISVLSIYPTSKGFAFVLFDGPLSPFDWGTTDVGKLRKSSLILEHTQKLLDRYCPDVLVLEEPEAKRSKRTNYLVPLHFSLKGMAELRGVNVRSISKAEIKSVFSRFGRTRKHDIAAVIARELTAFTHLLPPPRKPWTSESRQQGLFDASALALTYYAKEE